MGGPFDATAYERSILLASSVAKSLQLREKACPIRLFRGSVELTAGVADNPARLFRAFGRARVWHHSSPSTWAGFLIR